LTTEQYIEQLKLTATKLQSGKALQVAAQNVHADRVERIFDKGTVARGYNSTKEVWIENKFVTGGRNNGKTGKATKTSYFKSYKDYKGAIGFNNSYVNFRVTNDLQSDFANSQVSSGTGKPDAGEVIKVNNSLFVEKLRSQENIDKLEGNIKRFGNFVAFTSGERTKFNNILKQELIATLRGER